MEAFNNLTGRLERVAEALESIDGLGRMLIDVQKGRLELAEQGQKLAREMFEMQRQAAELNKAATERMEEQHREFMARALPDLVGGGSCPPGCCPPRVVTYDGPIGPRPDAPADASTDGNTDGGPIPKPKPSEGTSARLGLCGACGSVEASDKEFCPHCGVPRAPGADAVRGGA